MKQEKFNQLNEILFTDGMQGIYKYYCNKITTCLVFTVLFFLLFVLSLLANEDIKDKKDALIVTQNARIEVLEQQRLCRNDSLEHIYLNLNSKKDEIKRK